MKTVCTTVDQAHLQRSRILLRSRRTFSSDCMVSLVVAEPGAPIGPMNVLEASPSTLVALLWAVVTIVCFGSQTVHLKLRAVRELRAPWQLKMLFSAGVAIVGAMIAATLAAQSKVWFSKWGMFTALVWTPGTTMMLVATHRVGLGLTIEWSRGKHRGVGEA